jgi:histidinol-phosphate/aromatic aminotransferase/cobyric acid decarboxylase-like protein
VVTRAHGGLDVGELAALGLAGDEIVDFSVNVSPHGPTADVVAAIRAAPLDRYPDPAARAARAALGRLWGVGADRVVLAHGATELLWLLARLLLRAGDVAVIAEPTFSEFGLAADRLGARIVASRARPEDGFAFDDRRLSELIAHSDARAAYVCAPNNPTGVAVPMAALASLCARHPRVTFVIDQAFLSLSEGHAERDAPCPPNTVLVRSLTKDHALAGLRLGAAIARPDLCAALERERPSWAVGALAQAAAIACAAPAAEAAVAATRAAMLADRRALADALASRGARTFPSTTTFFLIDVGDAAAFRGRLLREHRLLVRDCTSFGLPGLIRVGARPAAERTRLVAAWERLHEIA